MKRLIIAEVLSDVELISRQLELSGKENTAVLLLYDELSEEYKDLSSLVEVIVPGQVLDRDSEFVSGIDDFAIEFSDKWFKSSKINNRQKYKNIDLGGIVYRDFMYYLIWVLKNTAVIRGAVETYAPEEVVVFVPEKEVHYCISAGKEERFAYKFFKNSGLRDEIKIKDIEVAAKPVSAKAKLGFAEKTKLFLDQIFCSWIKVKRVPDPSGNGRILFSSDIKHVLPIIKRIREEGVTDLFYLRPQIGIRSFLGLRKYGCNVLSDASTTHSAGGSGCIFPEEENLSGEFLYKDIDIFPFIEGKLRYFFKVESVGLKETIDKFEKLLHKVKPSAVIVEEDVCPFNKMLAQTAGERGIKTIVLQHGMMGIKSGFAPLSSDYFFCWGEFDQDRMKAWGVEENRLVVTGSPRHDSMFERVDEMRNDGNCELDLNREINVLYISSPFHSHFRPDFINSHITQESHLRTLVALCKLKQKHGGVKLHFKFHPRDIRKEETKNFIAKHFREDVAFYDKEDLSLLISRCDIVVSSWSSSCLEVMMFGKRLIIVNFSGKGEMYPIGTEGGAWLAYSEGELMKDFGEAMNISKNKMSIYQAKARNFIAKAFGVRDGLAVNRITGEIREILCQK